MKITINGTPGSGKSTLGRMLAEELGLKFLSIGDMRRKMAQDRDMTLAELNQLGESEEWTDKQVDNYQKVYGKEHDDFVIDGRLAWHFIPDSIKIFVDADPEERARRQVGRDLPEEDYDKVEEALNANKERMQSDRKRYGKYYSIDPYDKEKFDIIIDTTNKTPEETLREALDKIEHHKA